MSRVDEIPWIALIFDHKNFLGANSRKCVADDWRELVKRRHGLCRHHLQDFADQSRETLCNSPRRLCGEHLRVFVAATKGSVDTGTPRGLAAPRGPADPAHSEDLTCRSTLSPQSNNGTERCDFVAVTGPFVAPSVPTQIYEGKMARLLGHQGSDQKSLQLRECLEHFWRSEDIPSLEDFFDIFHLCPCERSGWAWFIVICMYIVLLFIVHLFIVYLLIHINHERCCENGAISLDR